MSTATANTVHTRFSVRWSEQTCLAARPAEVSTIIQRNSGAKEQKKDPGSYLFNFRGCFL